uniref:hypothetical protein n=1 Tax=Cellvibrio fontiphilus TaxID=1815559 RepID=UPI002B4BABB1|nr:hypothetical protein [Cellvibrio fontiphilus]
MTTINIGTQAYNSRDVAQKLQSDIGFLESRIALLRQQPIPNQKVLETYAQMLESRRAVLGWIMANEPAQALHMQG